MKEIRYTLLSEGSSDKALLPILNWLLQIHLPGYAIQSEWADLSRFPKPPKTLEKRVSASLKYYPCDVLFIHRDADNQGQAQRRNEINEAIERANLAKGISTICVIPVRMTEAWLLSDESAIRVAADSPKGHQTLDLPHLKSIENIADPKELLYTMLRQASQVSGRRLKRFNQRLSSRVQRISEMTQDFSPLRELEAFG
ncbi:MAG: hypothetical protein AAGJ95_11220, partial [Cyanobacteria bacterium J06554_11]